MGHPGEARKRILIAASNLLWEKSYHAVTVDEVCVRAEVRKGSLYHFFPSKSAMASEALQHFWTTVAQPAYHKRFSEHNMPLARIGHFLEWLRSFQLNKFREHGKVLGWPFFTLGCELASSEPEISEILGRIAALETCYFEFAISEARRQNKIEFSHPRATAISLQATIEGISGRARVLNRPEELDALTKFENFCRTPRTARLSLTAFLNVVQRVLVRSHWQRPECVPNT
ncbi:MAG: TetR family transcriptional regulator [Verrucomicrobiales bacterium]|nr:TetR family transcriptional regulator [Verrucomicrobiales bacterium]